MGLSFVFIIVVVGAVGIGCYLAFSRSSNEKKDE